jgi:hypothetical protein
MTTVDRINTLFADSVRAGFEATEAVQQQNRAVAEAWLNAFQAGQSITRELTLGSIGRTQEAQRLWAHFLQETTQAGVENFTTVARGAVKEANGTGAEQAAAR